MRRDRPTDRVDGWMAAAGAGARSRKGSASARPSPSPSLTACGIHHLHPPPSLPPSLVTDVINIAGGMGWRRRWRDKLQSRSCREPARDDGKDGWTDGRMEREAGSFHFRLCSARFNGLKRSGEDRYSVRPLTAMLAASFLRLWATKLSPPQVTQINCRKKLGVLIVGKRE